MSASTDIEGQRNAFRDHLAIAEKIIKEREEVLAEIADHLPERPSPEAYEHHEISAAVAELRRKADGYDRILAERADVTKKRLDTADAWPHAVAALKRAQAAATVHDSPAFLLGQIAATFASAGDMLKLGRVDAAIDILADVGIDDAAAKERAAHPLRVIVAEAAREPKADVVLQALHVAGGAAAVEAITEGGIIPGLVCTACDKPIVVGDVYAGRTGDATHRLCMSSERIAAEPSFRVAGAPGCGEVCPPGQLAEGLPCRMPRGHAPATMHTAVVETGWSRWCDPAVDGAWDLPPASIDPAVQPRTP